MKIAIINFEDSWMSLLSTSILKKINKDNPNCLIYYFCNEESSQLLKYNKNVITLNNFFENDQFDYIYNMSPKIDACKILNKLNSKNKIGFYEKNDKILFSSDCIKKYNSYLYQNYSTNKNILQIIYNFFGYRWKGEGYNLCYYPKCKTDKNKTGIYLKNINIKNKIINNIKLNYSTIYEIQNKNNVLKNLDEINKCMYIVTDDLFFAHGAIALRKHVEFLDFSKNSYKIEFFGKGNHYKVSNE